MGKQSRRKKERGLPLGPEASAAVTRQLERFRQKFGREPEPHDPLFFDENADFPRPMDEHSVTSAVVNAMIKADIRPNLIYAYAKTGMMVTEKNQSLWSAADLAEYDAALSEFDEMVAEEPKGRREQSV